MIVRFNGLVYTNVKDMHGVLGFAGLTHVAIAPEKDFNDVTEMRLATEQDIERFNDIGVTI